VVFDFDGVIADSEPLHLRALQEALASRGVRLDADEYYAQLLGYDDGAALDVLVEARALPWNARERAAVVADKTARFEALQAREDALFAGAAACVARLGATVPLAIASGARRAEIDRTLARVGLAAAFRAIIAAGDTLRGKPSPDPYARAVALLAVDPSRAVAIEDSRWGLQSASAAGLRTVGVTHSYPPSELAMADLVVSSLNEITVERLTALIRAR
jgi:beta-phosphoglucomutase-like phosphatase (HAD superfamily)